MAASTPAVTTEDVRCSVCYEYFDHKTHLPKRLPCPHSICLSCLGELAKIPPAKCPLCKRYFRIPADGVGAMATDLPTLKLLDMMTCQQCNTVEELSNCWRCKIRICQKCESIGHVTATRCKLTTNLCLIEEKLSDSKVQSALSQHSDWVQALKAEIERIYAVIRRELYHQEQVLKEAVRLSQLLVKELYCASKEQKQLEEYPALISKASSSLRGEASEEELSVILHKTEKLLDIMTNPPQPLKPAIQQLVRLTNFEKKTVKFLKGLTMWHMYQPVHKARKRVSAAESDKPDNDNTSCSKRPRTDTSAEEPHSP